EAGFAREDFAVGAVDEETQREIPYRPAVALFDGAQDGTVAVGAHDREQVVVAELPDGREALGQDLAVTAMRAEDVVVGGQREGHADRGRLLADGEVG